MWLKIWRFVAQLFVGLGLAMGAAHVLELPVKMTYSRELYASVNTTLYRYFGIAGAAITIGGLVASAVLVYLVRHRRSWPLTAAAMACLLVSFALWLTLVAPVNNQIEYVMRVSSASVPDVWMRLRERWEYGHVLAFLSWLLGYCFLQLSILREVPDRAPQLEYHGEPAVAATARSRAHA
jgi:MFS family permease